MERYSRSAFLRRAGAGALATSATMGGLSAASPAEAAASAGYGRMFSLPPFAKPTPKLLEALSAIGAPGGPMDANDDLALGAEALFLETYVVGDESEYRFSGGDGNHTSPISPAGLSFLAQFIAHDITFDALSPLGRPTSVARTMNARTVRFDLESIYGGGQTLAPQLYDASNRSRLALERNGRYEDVPRLANGAALIGDVRNDQSAILSGLHAAFLLFHNNALEETRSFERARQETRWHYQWLILNEFLPHVVQKKVLADVLRGGRKFFRPAGKPFVPVEFAAAAFRFGHSMVRPSYRLNFHGDGGRPFFAMMFDPKAGGGDPDDLRGGARAPRRYVDWESFFDFGDYKVRNSKRIDTTISTPLFHVPLGAIPGQAPPQSLPQRDLLRHVTFGLPSGQAVARKVGAPPLARHDLRELAPYGLDRSTPLFYYLLKEAEVVEYGLRLGPTGSRIVAEVVVGLLELDRGSYLHAKRWKPSFARGTAGMLRFAGVDPKSRSRT